MGRKTGHPRSLSALHIEVAKRIGLSLRGVGFPGHFLVKYVGAEGEIVIDPFNQGEILSQQNLETMLHRLYGAKIAFDPGLLEPICKNQILRRMLNNLKIIYFNQTNLIK